MLGSSSQTIAFSRHSPLIPHPSSLVTHHCLVIPPKSPPELVSEVSGGALLNVHVTPRAGRSTIAGVRRGALLVRLAAAPVEGAANEALVALIAEQLRIPRTHVTIVTGARARTKRLLIAGVAASALAARLAALLSARSSPGFRDGR